MAKFRKKPVVVEAIRINQMCTIRTLEGDMIGHVGDWLITGVAGEQYPCINSIFLRTYEPASDDAEDLYEQARKEYGGEGRRHTDQC